ncbi:MAG: hypothetical protein CL840_12815 [Crocinitomicaceae bacterium]|nr:hypothetical protein [Crocinitomicaceae bacterium]|tara:strand:- start:3224 stop:3934 length:711 start_codon:yes stop_codon:yes gene_type:complete
MKLIIEHKAILVRDLQWKVKDLVKFAERFGKIQNYPFSKGHTENPGVLKIINNPFEKRKFSSIWHSDSTYLENPPEFTFLYAIDIPEIGGDTVISNTEMAYESLSSKFQEFLKNLEGVYVSNLNKIKRSKYFKGENKFQIFKTCHPIILLNKDSKKYSIYANREHTSHIKDLNDNKSNAVLKLLQTVVSKHEFSYRINWKPGTLVVFDNRSTQHRALVDYDTEPRTLYRITIRLNN